MNARTVCRICKTEGVRLHCITKTHLQEMYEREIHTMLTTDDDKPTLACIECCDRLQHCYQLSNGIEQRKNTPTMVNLDPQLLIGQNDLHQNNTCVQSDVEKCIKMEPEQLNDVEVKQESTTDIDNGNLQDNDIELEKNNQNSDTEHGSVPRIIKVESVNEIQNEPNVTTIEEKPIKMDAFRINNEMKHRIINLQRQGVPVTDIANELGISRNTVYRWTVRWNTEGILQQHVTTGRPRRTNIDQDIKIVQRARNDRFVNTKNLAFEFGVSQATVRRRFQEQGVHNRIPAKKPELTPRHKAQRLAFARRYLDYNFEKVVFIDEKVFCLTARGLSLWRLNNTRYEDGNVLPGHRSGRITLGFWGWMSQSGPGELVEVGGRLNGQKYRNILSDVLLPTARVFYPNETIRFIQDNSSVHNSRIVTNYLNQTRDLERIVFPPSSPDLNPIENLWGKVIQLWDNTAIRTTENLRRHVENVWESLRGDRFCFNAVQSMRQRLSDVIIAEGGYTPF